MSKIKIVENLFLGKQELNRFRDFLEEHGFKRILKLLTKRYGVVKQSLDVPFNSLKVIQGSSPTKLSLLPGYAIDRDLNTVVVDLIQNDILTVPANSIHYNVVIKYGEKNIEKGKVSVNSSGQLVGTDTEFTKVLRGIPHHRLKVKFPNSLLNTQEYVVNVVNNDVSATIQGASFSAETDLDYLVIGAFTPGVFVPDSDKKIYSYDNFSLQLLPTSYQLIEGVHFVLALVSSDGVNLNIIDQRQGSLYSLSQGDSSIDLQSSNAVAGIEWVKFDSVISQTGGEDLVKFSWGVRSPDGSWQLDLFLGKIIISLANGGIMSSISTFVNGSFDGWRVYFSNGEYCKILTSSLVSNLLELSIEGYSSSLPLTGDIAIVPDADFILVDVNRTVSPLSYEETFQFSMNKSYAAFFVHAGGPLKLTFRYKTRGSVSQPMLVNDGLYLAPTSFNSNGVQVGNDTSPVVGGVFTPAVNEFSLWLRVPYLAANNVFNLNTINNFQGKLISGGRLDVKGGAFVGPSDVQVVSSSGVLSVDKTDMNIGAIASILFNGFQNEEEGKIFILRNNWDSSYNITVSHLASSVPTRQRISLTSGSNLVITPGRAAQFMHVVPDSNASDVIGFGWVQI